jgi:hypothetical protein
VSEAVPRVTIASIALLCCTVAAAQERGELEIWLASTDRCNSCEIFEEAARRRGYGDTLTYVRGGERLEIPIKRVSKSALPPRIAAQLIGDAGPRSRYWQLQLTVFVVRGNRVLHQGNIAESADLRTAAFAPRVMFPPEDPAPGDPALRESLDYEQFFAESWNLEYFAAVALGDAPPRRTQLLDLASPLPAALGSANVILWGAAGTPIRNGYFTARRIMDIRATLEQQLQNAAPTFVTLYGHGPGGRYNDTSVLQDGVTTFVHAGVAADYAADLDGANSVLTALARTPRARSLLIHVGHSGPTGIPLWGRLGTVSVEDLRAAGRNPDSRAIMVSGGCHSGVFATALQCGFFAAHPEILASGCQLSEEAVASSDDYLRLFFERLAGEPSGGGSQVDTSLAAAHWYAATRIEHHQISYTTVDALADEHFAAAPPQSLSVEEIRQLAKFATPEEASALADLTAPLDDALHVSLTDLVERNHAAQRALASATELPSAQRNAILALPYKLQLPALARRLLYRSHDAGTADLQRATECEGQSIASFLTAP